ncbi:restriction endonuclease subunit S [Vaginisenegalia massiliensis]|uniref:restriction endonuclease subunit S n=1 Tax=Vaginisenegalia massiliensis TaxID=2058294 RepID=UPI000F546737|nr:restriction endonuclease subunit S [Vaginisenegalia massiliensis]
MTDKKKPAIRFKGFTDDWEQRKFGDIWKNTSNKNKNLDYNENDIISVANMKFKNVQNNTSEDYLKTYNILKYGDIAFEGNKSKDFSYGRFVLNNIGTGIVSHVFITFEPIQKIGIDFMRYYINYEGIMKHILVKSTTKTIMMTTLIVSDIKKQNLLIPDLYEQEEIGLLLTKIDNSITLHQKELEILKEMKKGLLQKLFPDGENTVPRIRFAGFTDDWEQRKLNYLLDSDEGLRRGPFGSALKKEFFVSDEEFVVYEQQNAIYDRYTTRYNISKEKFYELKKFHIKPGDFIMSGAGTIGRISLVPSGIKPGVFNQALIRLRINHSITDSMYFLHFLKSEETQRRLTSRNPGSAMVNLVPISELKEWTISVPKKTEQTYIGQLIEKIENSITLHQRELDILKDMKKALLQKMFV